jgi:hypothetical protein
VEKVAKNFGYFCNFQKNLSKVNNRTNSRQFALSGQPAQDQVKVAGSLVCCITVKNQTIQYFFTCNKKSGKRLGANVLNFASQAFCKICLAILIPNSARQLKEF